MNPLNELKKKKEKTKRKSEITHFRRSSTLNNNNNIIIIKCLSLSFSPQILDTWSPKLSHENDGLIFNPAEEVKIKKMQELKDAYCTKYTLLFTYSS